MTEMSDLKADIAALRKDAKKIMDDLAKIAGSELEEGKDYALKTAKGVARRAGHLEGEAESYIKENPLAAVAIAAGVGAMAALLVARR